MAKSLSPQNEVLNRIPWRMHTVAKDLFVVSKMEGARSLKLAQMVVGDLGTELARQGLGRWEEVKPVHYETWLRRKQTELRMGTEQERKDFAGASTKAREIFTLVQEETPSFENPAEGIAMTPSTSIMKRVDSVPELDDRISQYIHKPDQAKAQANLIRGSLRTLAGSLLAHDITRWEDLKPGHMDIIARVWVDASKNAGKPSAGKIQADLRYSRMFLDKLVKDGVLKENPAEDIVVTLRGHVTTPEGLNPKMFQQANDFIKAHEKDKLSTNVTRTTNVRRFTTQMCAEHDLKEWSEVTPAHAELFLRREWTQGYENAHNAMFVQSSARDMLDYLKDQKVIKRNPMDGMAFTLKGEFTAKNRKPERLPERPEAAMNKKLADKDPLTKMPEGFRQGATEYRDAAMRDRISSVPRIHQTLPEFAQFAIEQEARNWQEVSRETLADYGNKLFREVGGNTAANKFCALRGLFKSLSEKGIVKANPMQGVRVIAFQEVVIDQDLAPLAMEQEIHLCANERVGKKLRPKFVETCCKFAAEVAERGKDWKDVTIGDVSGHLDRVAGDANRANARGSLKSLFVHLQEKNLVTSLPIPLPIAVRRLKPTTVRVGEDGLKIDARLSPPATAKEPLVKGEAGAQEVEMPA